MKAVLLAILCHLVMICGAQTSVHFLVSNNWVMLGDSAKITPIVSNLKPNSKIKIMLSDPFNDTVIEFNGTNAFYFKPIYGSKSIITLSVMINSYDKLYFTDTQYLTFNCYKLSGDIYSTRGFNTMYVGLDNSLKIAAPGIPESDLIINGEGCSIMKSSGNEFIVKVFKEGEGKIQISARREDGTIIAVNRVAVKFKYVPKPTVVADISVIDTTIYLKSMLIGKYEYPYSSGVDSFTVSYRKNGKIVSKVIQGSKLDPNTYNEIMNLPSGTWIYFENIIYWVNIGGINSYKTHNLAIKT